MSGCARIRKRGRSCDAGALPHDIEYESAAGSQTSLRLSGSKNTLAIFVWYGPEPPTDLIRPNARACTARLQSGRLEELVQLRSSTDGAVGQSSSVALSSCVLPQLSTLRTLLVDPPRSGLDDTVVDIARRFFQYVLYISCNPATLLRDIRALAGEASSTEMNGRQVQPRVIRFATFDQFPYTSHLECGVLLELVRMPGKASNCNRGTTDHAAGCSSTSTMPEPQPQLEESANVRRDKRGRTALHLAASTGSAEAVSSLLSVEKCPTFVDATDRDGCSALMRACEPGHVEVANVLLATGAATDLADKWGRTALHCAALKGRTAAVSLLLSHSTTDPQRLTNLLDKHCRSPLHYAAFSAQGSAEMVELLVCGKSDLGLRDEYAQTPLDRAVSSGRAVAVAALVAARADLSTIDKHGRTALHCAVSVRDNLSVVSALLKSSLDSTTVEIADESGGVPQSAQTPAAIAMVNQRDKKGRTALFIAAAAGVVEAVELLIHANADVNVSDSFGVSPLSAAAAKAAALVVTMLLDADAARDTQDNDGCTALHHAALHGHSEIVATLLARDADGTIQSNNGVVFNSITPAIY